MSYDLHFVVPEGSTPVRRIDLARYFASRRGYRVHEAALGATPNADARSSSIGSIAFENEDTGVSFVFFLGVDGGPRPVSLTVNYHRPHVFGLEAEREATALATHFGFHVDDTQPEGMGRGPYSPDGMLRGYAIGNAAAHAALFDRGVSREGTYALPSGVLTSAWRWNVNRALVQTSFSPGESVFIPKIVFVVHPISQDAATAVVWSRFMPALLPLVDVYLLVTDEHPRPLWLDREELAEILEKLPAASASYRFPNVPGRPEAGSVFFDARSAKEPHAARIVELGRAKEAARSQADPPKLMPLEKVLSKEIARGVPVSSRSMAPRRDFDDGNEWSGPTKIVDLAVSLEARILAGVGPEGVTLFDLESGRWRSALGPAYAGSSLGLSHDGRTLALGDARGNVSVFDLHPHGFPALALRRVHGFVDAADASDGEPIVPARVFGVSADGSIVIAAAHGDVLVLHAPNEAGDETTHEIGWRSGAVATSNKRHLVLVGKKLVDVDKGKPLTVLPSDIEHAKAAAFSHDDARIAYVTSQGGVLVVDIATASTLATGETPSDEGMRSATLAFGADEKLIVATAAGGVHVFDAATLTHERSIASDANPARPSIAATAIAIGAPRVFHAFDSRIVVTAVRQPETERLEVPLTSPAQMAATMMDNGGTNETTISSPPLLSDDEAKLEAARQYKLGYDALDKSPETAIEPLRYAAATFTRILGAGSMQAVLSGINHGLALLQCERYYEAVTVLRPIVIAARRSPDVWKQAIPVLHNLGLALVRSGSPADALPLLDEALAIRERDVGMKHPVYVDTALVKAAALIELDKLDEAKPIILLGAQAVLDGAGESHHMFAEAVLVEAQRVAKAGDGLRADALARRALRITEKGSGRESFTYRDRAERASALREHWRNVTKRAVLGADGGAGFAEAETLEARRKLCVVTVSHTLRRWQPRRLDFADSSSLPKVWWVDAPAAWVGTPNDREIREGIRWLFAKANDELNAREPDDPNYLDLVKIDVKPLAREDLPGIDWERAWRERVWEPSGAYIISASEGILEPLSRQELQMIVSARSK